MEIWTKTNKKTQIAVKWWCRNDTYGKNWMV